MVSSCAVFFFFFSSRRRHTRLQGDWSSDVCSSDLGGINGMAAGMGLGVVKAMVAPAVVWPAPDYDTVADSVRDFFRSLDLDPANPLGQWIRPGMTVVVKPNWVKHEFGSTVGRNVLFTHASLVRVLIDAALTALAGHGRVYVADAPLQGCDFARFRR